MLLLIFFIFIASVEVVTTNITECSKIIINKVHDKLIKEIEFGKLHITKRTATNALENALQNKWETAYSSTQSSIIAHSLDGIKFDKTCSFSKQCKKNYKCRLCSNKKNEDFSALENSSNDTLFASCL